MALVQISENELQTRGRLVRNALKERDNCIVLKVDTRMDKVEDMSPFGFHFELDKKIYARQKKRLRWKKLTKWFSWIAYYHHKFGIRHITLVLILISYVFIGGAIFEALESNNEIEDLKSTIMLMNGIIYEEVNDIRNLTGTLNLPQNQSDELNLQLARLIKRYYKSMLEAEGRFHGSVWHKAENLDMHLMWYFSSATFYSMTLFSTIGYGTITCQTFWGRTVSMIYASFGLPLMLVVLGDIGEWFQKFLTSIYIFILFKIKQWRGIKLPTDRSKIFLPMWLALFIVLTYIVACSLIIKGFDHSEGHRPGIGYSDAFYFTFISLTTIGLGDVMPYNIQYSPFLSATFLLGLALISIVNTSIYAQMYGGFFKVVQDIEHFLDRIHKHNQSKGQGYHVFRELEPCLLLLVCSFPHIESDKRLDMIENFRDSFRLRDKLGKRKREKESKIVKRRTNSDLAVHGERKFTTDSDTSIVRYRAPTLGAFGGFDLSLFKNPSQSKPAAIRLDMTPEVDQPIDIPSSYDDESDSSDTDEGYIGAGETPASSSTVTSRQKLRRASSEVPSTPWRTRISKNLISFVKGNQVHPRTETIQSDGGRYVKRDRSRTFVV